MSNVDTVPIAEFSDLWAVHSKVEDRPAIAAWARSEQEAKAKMAELKQTGPRNAPVEYWVMRMTKNQVEVFKRSGFIPADA
jgi:hypothetical protein